MEEAGNSKSFTIAELFEFLASDRATDFPRRGHGSASKRGLQSGEMQTLSPQEKWGGHGCPTESPARSMEARTGSRGRHEADRRRACLHRRAKQAPRGFGGYAPHSTRFEATMAERPLTGVSALAPFACIGKVHQNTIFRCRNAPLGPNCPAISRVREGRAFSGGIRRSRVLPPIRAPQPVVLDPVQPYKLAVWVILAYRFCCRPATVR